MEKTMTASATKSFTAVLEPDRTRLRWVIARVPFDVATTWPKRRGLRVRGIHRGRSLRPVEAHAADHRGREPGCGS